MRIAGTIAGIMAAVSIAASGYFLRAVALDNWVEGGQFRQVRRIPLALLPPGTRQQLAGRPLDAADRPVLAAAVWRDPLNQRFANIHYTDLLEQRAPDTVIARQSQRVAALGWRDSPAQLNLILSGALAGDLHRMLDRADALLRRQKLLASANQMLAALEATPSGAALVRARLATRPPWRSDYLVASAQSASPAFLLIRADTLDRLSAVGTPPSRREIAPVLTGLIAAGQGDRAYALWSRINRVPRASIVQDTEFRAARRIVAANDAALPFDWQLNGADGFGVLPARDGQGLEIDWDGKGIPVFLSQVVPVRPRVRYRLTIAGQGNAIGLIDLFQPALVCGSRQLPFDPVGTGGDRVAFRSEPVPAGCTVAALQIGARLRDDAAPVGAVVRQIEMAPDGA